MSASTDTPLINPDHHKSILIWLIGCAIMVALMVLIGGLTRLTESGLSIVEWNVVMGILPPFSEQSWLAEFEKYRQSPEYLKINKGMSLADFKNIFWLEYIHRLIGRLIGLVFFLPLLYFTIKKVLKRPILIRLITLFILGGLQGVVGWYMVKSGLIDTPWVSPYRLAFHLSLAFIIFAGIFWTILDLIQTKKNEPPPISKKLFPFAVAFTTLVLVQIILGAFVAGLDAGLTYNTFPLMDNKWIPSDMWLIDPTWRNLFENVTTVQFNHRAMAYGVAVATLFFWYHGRKYVKNENEKWQFTSLLLLVIFQIALGIGTLLMHVPITLASLHQMTALALFAQCIKITHAAHHNWAEDKKEKHGA